MQSYNIYENLPYLPFGINWTFISSISPYDLYLKHDKHTMKIIIQDFLNARNFEGVPITTLTHFLSILQIIMKTLITNQKKTLKKLDDQIKDNEVLKRKIQKNKLETSYNSDYSDNNLEILKDTSKLKIAAVVCPVCLNCYTSLKFLDQHFFTHHYEFSEIWQALRTPHINGITRDPTLRLLGKTTDMTDAIEILGEETLNYQKNKDTKIRSYFKEKFLEVNRKLDKISINMNENNINTTQRKKIRSKKNRINNFIINSSSSKVFDTVDDIFNIDNYSSNFTESNSGSNNNYNNKNRNNDNYNNDNNNYSNDNDNYSNDNDNFSNDNENYSNDNDHNNNINNNNSNVNNNIIGIDISNINNDSFNNGTYTNTNNFLSNNNNFTNNNTNKNNKYINTNLRLDSSSHSVSTDEGEVVIHTNKNANNSKPLSANNNNTNSISNTNFSTSANIFIISDSGDDGENHVQINTNLNRKPPNSIKVQKNDTSGSFDNKINSISNNTSYGNSTNLKTVSDEFIYSEPTSKSRINSSNINKPRSKNKMRNFQAVLKTDTSEFDNEYY